MTVCDHRTALAISSDVSRYVCDLPIQPLDELEDVTIAVCV